MVFDLFHAALKATESGRTTPTQGIRDALFIDRFISNLNDGTKT